MAISGYVVEFQGDQFAPHGKLSEIVDVDEHNRDLETREMATWATSPDRGNAYVKGSKVVSFLGTVMGDIISRRSYKNNTGAKIEAITVKGTNGSLYYGRYGVAWNEFCLLHKRKTKRIQAYRKNR